MDHREREAAAALAFAEAKAACNRIEMERVATVRRTVERDLEAKRNAEPPELEAPEEVSIRAMLRRLTAADPENVNIEVAAWKGRLSRELRGWGSLRALERVQRREAAAIAARPPRVVLPVTFGDITDRLVVRLAEPHPTLNDLQVGGVSIALPWIAFLRESDAGPFVEALAAWQTDPAHGHLGPSERELAVVINDWSDPVVVMKAGGFGGHEAGAFLPRVRDLRVLARWLRAAAPGTKLAEAIGREAAGRPGLASFNDAVRFWGEHDAPREPVPPATAQERAEAATPPQVRRRLSKAQRDELRDLAGRESDEVEDAANAPAEIEDASAPSEIGGP